MSTVEDDVIKRSCLVTKGKSNCDCMTLTGEMERYWNWKRMQNEIMNGAHVCVVVYSCTVVRALL